MPGGPLGKHCPAYRGKNAGHSAVLDNVGSIATAALCGGLPGIVVGYLSNVINSASDPITLYYGVLTVLMAAMAARFSHRGWFKTWRGCCMAVLSFSLIGGACGSLLTWALYGGGIGEGISAPYAYWLLGLGFPEFWAQFTADMLIDIPDKALTVLVVWAILRFYPKALYDKFPLSYLYDRDNTEIRVIETRTRQYYRKRSLNTKIVSIISITAALLSVFSVFIGLLFYHSELTLQYSTTVTNASRMGASFLDGDDLERYTEEGAGAEGYAEDKAELTNAFNSFADVTYLYVYQVLPDGCHVLFDLDTPDMPADPFGTLVPFDPGFEHDIDALLAGQEIAPIVTNDSYGWLFTAYTPVYNSAGLTVAYVGADLNMENYMYDLLAFVIHLAAILFGITILIIALSVWYAIRTISTPLDNIIVQSRALDRTPPEVWLESRAWKDRAEVRTGDEIEQVYHAVSDVQENVSRNVMRLKETERQLLESQELELKNRELAQAIKRADEANAAKSEFLSRMSHALRTPLNGIIGVAEIASDQLDNRAETEQNLADIKASGTFMLELVNDILDMSKIESGKIELHPAPCALSDIAQAIRTMFQPLCDTRGIVLSVDACDDIPPVIVDKMRLQQVIFNLLSNAVKFTPAGGHVDFISTCSVSRGRVDVDFMVRDDGVGMSDDFQLRMYESFSQENSSIGNNRNGSGLGLPIAKSLVELMGGSMSCSSAMGSGTTFDIQLTFPLANPLEVGHVSTAPINYARLFGCRVLLCEDHPLNAKIVISLLERVGVQVDHAENGKVGIEMLEAADPGSYNAVLMDIRMPVMDGLQATWTLRTLEGGWLAQIPIIALTANAFSGDVKAAFDAGINAHLAKPVDPEALYRALVECLPTSR